jgi:hypothetical protein
MTLNDQKCAFSEAWLRAVAAAAGFGVQGAICPDDQSVDITIASTIKGITTKPRLDVQLKCSAGAWAEGMERRFALRQPNYEDLRDANTAVPKILVLVQVPEDDPTTWLVSNAQRLEVYQTAWWVSLRGLPANMNDERTTIGIPSTQRFTPEALRDIMNRLAEGSLP